MDGLAHYLSRFEDANLVRQVQSGPESEYWFKHILIQEAIYDSLLRSARVELHGRVAEAIEQIADGREEERAAILALHYERAGLQAKAFNCAVVAGDHARRHYAHREALDFYERALAAARSLAEPRLLGSVRDVYVSRGTIFEVIGDHRSAASNYREMLAVASDSGNPAVQADALIHLATVQIFSGGAPDLAKNLDQALTLARQSADPILIGRALWSQGLALRFNHPLSAIELWQQALALAQSTDEPNASELAASVLLDLRVGLMLVGRMREGLAYAHQAEVAFRALGNVPMLIDALGGVAHMCYLQADVITARSAGAEAVRLSRELSNPWGAIHGEWGLLETEIDVGHFEEVLASAERRLLDAQMIGFSPLIGVVLMHTARAWLELGVGHQARSLAQESLAAFEESHSPVWSTWGRGFTGHILTACGDLAAGHELLDGLWEPGEDVTSRMEGFMVAAPAIVELALADHHSTQELAGLDFGLQVSNWYLSHFEAEGSWRLAGEMRYLRGQLHLARGDLAAAETDLAQARAWLAAAEANALLWRVDAALVELHRALHDRSRAMKAHSRAVELIGQLASGINDPALRHSFLARPDVRQVTGMIG
jgi:tetratricopeptide (TPR) repeat protein